MDIASIIKRAELQQEIVLQKFTQEQYDQQTENIVFAVSKFFQHHYGKPFVVDKDNEKQVLALAYYFTGNPRFEEEQNKTHEMMMDYKLNKGLLLLGDYGCGKSSLLHCFCEVLKTVRQGFLRYSFLDIDDLFVVNGYSCFNEHRKPYAKYYDDFGQESLQAGNYGNKESVAVKIAEFRYRLFVESGVKTHYSTNMNGESFKTRYTDFIYSRIKESCNIINFATGTKNRRTTN